MRLKQIKLAGFKSFVDPTTVQLKRNLIGIVGPNGCGKSNIIDAVRWVMGEGSAKTLRGESMADVIFNGSSGRKPVGQAAIELSFDNSDGSLGGEYAKFGQIDIRREVSRDGTSDYFLNGTRCRRRDIIDIFLGTGLGPRSYSIIEQGTISKFVEAKPADLRVFIEEAAGITKYKERRRETENRIKHTRENLERLTDIREELEKQINHLKRQANVAERFKVLKEEERLVKAQLQALHFREMNEQRETQERSIANQEVAFEAKRAELRKMDAQNENLRELLLEHSDVFSQIQSNYYNIGSVIAKIEQDIQYRKQRCKEIEYDIQQITYEDQKIHHQIETDSQELNQLQQDLQQLAPALQDAKLVAERSAQTLTMCQEAMRDWQGQWDIFNEQAAQSIKQAEVEQTQIQHLEHRLNHLQTSITANEKEFSELSQDKLNSEIELLEAQHEELQASIAEHEQQLLTVSQQIKQKRQQNEELLEQINQFQNHLQDLQSQFSSLEALQKIALGQDETVTLEWLTQHNLQQQPRLAQCFKVDNGWEKAVEIVLSNQLQAVCVDDIQSLATSLSDDINVMLYQKGTTAEHNLSGNNTRLIDKIDCAWSLKSLLADIFIVETLQEAFAMQSQLAENESVITREGVWLGKNWLKITAQHSKQTGILQRVQELNTLEQELQAAKLKVNTWQDELNIGKQQLLALEETRDSAQQNLAQVNAENAKMSTQIGIKHNHRQQIQQRAERIQTQLYESRQQVEQTQTLLVQARDVWQMALEKMQLQNEQREQLVAMREDSRASLDNAQLRSRNDREQVHQLELRAQEANTRVIALQQAIQRMEHQAVGLKQKQQELQRQLTELNEPLTELQEKLEDQLSKRLGVEEELTTARHKVEHIEQQIRELNDHHAELDEYLQQQRTELEQLRMSWQALEVRLTTINEQLTNDGFILTTLLNEMPMEANQSVWQERALQLEQRISRLGPINLAAIDEYNVQIERKGHLDSQNDDLVEALTTLENAIRKIDKETRTRLQETFDKVNNAFKELFPKVFGGGSAYLELTGDDLLEAGITVMARPPGKRNSTIHLLSGGEKALTAVSLVFAIFQLNPAPFCLLDEVDAPLDDHNVVRFCELVKEMSQKVQFIIITHNKVTMEMVEHLCGVTMNEPGVSRLVVVDIEEAVAMAGA